MGIAVTGAILDLELVRSDSDAYEMGVNQGSGFRRSARRRGQRFQSRASVNVAIEILRFCGSFQPDVSLARSRRLHLYRRAQRVNDGRLKGWRRQAVGGGGRPISRLHCRRRDVVPIANACLMA